MTQVQRVAFTLMVFCLTVFALGQPAQAQIVDPVMGECAGWMPPSLTAGCTFATPALDIGSTANPSPTFGIATNDHGLAADAVLLALVPGSSSLSFTANFTQGSSTHSVSTAGALWSSGTLLQSFLGLTVSSTSMNGGPNDYTISGGGGAALSGIQVLPGVTSYTVYKLDTGFPVSGPQNTTPETIAVSFSSFSGGSGFPVGTIFLSLGCASLPCSAGSVVNYTTPLTVGVEVVPEPTTMLLLGSGLVGLGSFARRRRARS